jgi:hypothetical protein
MPMMRGPSSPRWSSSRFGAKLLDDKTEEFTVGLGDHCRSPMESQS